MLISSPPTPFPPPSSPRLAAATRRRDLAAVTSDLAPARCESYEIGALNPHFWAAAATAESARLLARVARRLATPDPADSEQLDEAYVLTEGAPERNPSARPSTCPLTLRLGRPGSSLNI